MVKKSKLAKSRLDRYYWQAKDQGYRSRSSFKLIQIDRKFKFLSSAVRVIDLCAAPGGWLQVCKKMVPLSSQIIGVDLVKIASISGVITLQDDITSASCKTKLNNSLGGKKVDLVLNDGAPNVGGIWDKDSFSQIELSLSALRLAVAFLRPNGTFVCKVFRSRDYTAFLDACRHFFGKVSAMKPHSSRASSAEIFVICTNFNGTRNLKSKMLDPKHVFRTEEKASTAQNVFKTKKTRPNRDGYDRDLLEIKSISAINFIKVKKPEEVLATVERIEFDEESLEILAGFEINQEILELSKDLQVLGKSDFRDLIKWKRKASRFLGKKFRKNTKEKTITADGNSDDEKEMDSEEKFTAELSLTKKREEELLEMLKRRDRKKKKRKHRVKMRSLKKMKKEEGNHTNPISDEEELFSLKKPAIEQKHVDEISEHEKECESENYLEEQEKYFDNLYEEFQRNLQLKEKKKPPKTEQNEQGSSSVQQNEINDENNTKNETEINNKIKSPETGNQKSMEYGIFKEYEDFIKAELNDSKDTFEKVKQEISTGVEENGIKCGFKRKLIRQNEEKDKETDEEIEALRANLEVGDVDLYRGISYRTLKKEKRKKLNKVRECRLKYQQEKLSKKDLFFETKETKGKVKNGIEEVPFSDFSSDDEAIAETLALGKVLQSKKRRNELIEDSFHKNIFHDHDLVPKWFAEEEKERYFREKPVSEAEIEKMRAYIGVSKAKLKREKHEQEALARKKMRRKKLFEKVKGKISTVVNAKDMSVKQKNYEIEKLQKSYLKKKKKPVVYQVTRKGGRSVRTKQKAVKNARVKKVDRRMKADNRKVNANLAKTKRLKGKGKGKIKGKAFGSTKGNGKSMRFKRRK